MRGSVYIFTFNGCRSSFRLCICFLLHPPPPQGREPRLVYRPGLRPFKMLGKRLSTGRREKLVSGGGGGLARIFDGLFLSTHTNPHQPPQFPVQKNFDLFFSKFPHFCTSHHRPPSSKHHPNTSPVGPPYLCPGPPSHVSGGGFSPYQPPPPCLRP
jgi:hypothetical protein